MWFLSDRIDTVPNDGLIRYFWFFNEERVLLTSPKALAEVLSTDSYSYIKPPDVSNIVGKLLGFGVLLAEGDEHKVQRRNLMPAFAFRHVKNLYPVFWGKSREVVQVMTALCSGQEETNMNVNAWSSRCTLDIIGVAGLGRDFGSIQDMDNHLVKTYNHVFTPSKQALWMALLGAFVPLWFISWLPVQRNEDVREAALEIRAVCRDLIRSKKARLAEKEEAEVDILSVAMQSGLFTDDMLVDQLMTFLAAGHETTSSSLTWAIYTLCRFPEMQTRLRQEIRDGLPPLDDETKITSMDVERLPYLQAVCNEVLRYYPPVPLTFRTAVRDTVIQGQHIPRNTRVVIAPSGTGKDVTLWGPGAGNFDPERWMPEAGPGSAPESNHQATSRRTTAAAASGGATSNYAQLTFLQGPRSCIAQGFAKAELACLLAAWVGRFEFALQDEREMDERNVVLKAGLTSRPANGVPVKVKVVGGW